MRARISYIIDADIKGFFFLAGLTVEEFYLETLLHETTHLCGIGGATAIREGFAELKTRELAQKYGVKTSACGYPKEVKIAYQLQNIFGKEIGDKIAFARDDNEISKIIYESHSSKGVDLYFNVANSMEEQFESYKSKRYPSVLGPLKKMSAYNKIDYSKTNQIIRNYIPDFRL